MKKNIFSEKSYFWYLLGQYHFKKSVSTYNILHEKSWPLFYSALVLCSYFYIIYIYENIPWKNKIFVTISDHRYLNQLFLKPGHTFPSTLGWNNCIPTIKIHAPLLTLTVEYQTYENWKVLELKITCISNIMRSWIPQIAKIIQNKPK